MSIAESIKNVIDSLPPEQQAEALALLQQFRQAKVSGLKLNDPYGILTNAKSDLTLEDFQKARQEMWKFRDEDAA